MWSRNGKVWSSEIKYYVESKVSQSRGVEWPLASTQASATLHVACETLLAFCVLTISKQKFALISIFTYKKCDCGFVEKKTSRF